MTKERPRSFLAQLAWPHFQQQAQACLALVRSLRALAREPDLPSDIRAETERSEATAARLLADTVLRWESFGGTVEFLPAVPSLADLIVRREEEAPPPPLVVSEPSAPPPESASVPPPKPSPPAKVVIPPPLVVDVVGDQWKAPLAERLRAILADPARDALTATVYDRAFLNGLPDQVCTAFLEYATAQSSIWESEIRRLDVICEVQRYTSFRKIGFVYGVARSHFRREKKDGWERRMAETIAYLWQQAGAPEAKAATRGSVIAQLRADLERPQDDDAIADLAERAVASGLPTNDTQLVNLFRPHLPALASRRSLKGLRRAIRTVIETEAKSEEPAAEGVVPANWEFFEKTIDRRAVIVGGIPAPEHAERIRDTFGFHSAEWEDAEHSPRTLDRIQQRVRGGTYDFVLILTDFVGHKAEAITREAKRVGVPCIHVRRGYGLSRVKQAIEIEFGGSSADRH